MGRMELPTWHGHCRHGSSMGTACHEAIGPVPCGRVMMASGGAGLVKADCMSSHPLSSRVR